MERPECNICGETKPHSDFLDSEGCSVRFTGGNMALIKIKRLNGAICTRCLRLMENMLASSKVLYPKNVRKQLWGEEGKSNA
jgi:hypothetical protein